jgi:cytoskeletal protein CcmA (bactofilin family)
MKNTKKEKKTSSISTFLGADARIEGKVHFQGAIRLDGSIKGSVTSNGGTAIVGEKAVVEADMDVGVAIVMGTVEGTITAKERIEIYPPGRVVGDIQAPVISIEAGGLFNGGCTMESRGAQDGKVKKVPSASTGS